jgi:hypothetical protein
MPVQLEFYKEGKRVAPPKVVLPGEFHFAPDFSTGIAEMVGFYCQEKDLGQAVFRVTQGVEDDGTDVHFNTDEINDLDIQLKLEEDTVCEYEIVDQHGSITSIASYHLGGLAVHYVINPS